MKKTVITLLAIILIITAAHSAAASDAPDTEPDIKSETQKLLAAYIGGCEGARDIASMTAVGAVILNRCRAEGFPDTVSANGASLGIFPTPAPSPIAEYAARLAISGLDPTSGALFFYNKANAGSHKGEYVTFSSSDLCFVR